MSDTHPIAISLLNDSCLELSNFSWSELTSHFLDANFILLNVLMKERNYLQLLYLQ